MKNLFRKHPELSMIVTAVSMVLVIVVGTHLLLGNTGERYSVAKDVSEIKLTEAQKLALSDPTVNSFVADEVFDTDVWKAFTDVNGWSAARTDLESRIEHVLSPREQGLLGIKDSTERFLVEATGDKPWTQELPVYESILRSATKACISDSQTPAEYIEAHKSEAPAVLQFTPKSAADDDIASSAYVASASAAVRHLCPGSE